VPITGLGQMRWLQGQWRAEMQMATDSSTIVTHWAYMTQITADVTPPEPTAPPIDPSLMADEWRWLEGTHWAINDSALLGSSTGGVFQIDSFRNGYFWGSGTGSQPFNLLGSVTPEGNLLLMVSVDGATPTTQTGQLRQTSSGGTMVLRTYEGQPTAGTAWQIDAAQTPSANSPISTATSSRSLMSSRQAR
jgi:hypothetical protein